VKVITTPITGSSLARTAIESGDSRWYVRRPTSADEWKARAEQARNSLIAADWAAKLAPALNASGPARERLERAAASGIAVTTGQQPGLFGGPLYTWWKAITAVALADRLENLTGIPVVPIFWAATDDSDFAEGSYTIVSTADGAERIQMHGDPPAGTPLSEVPLGNIDEQMARLEHATGSGANGRVLEAVRAAYRPGATIGGAYVELLRSLLEPLGVPVLDAAHPAVREAAFPLLRSAVERADQIDSALAARTRDLKQDGHATQVKLVKGRTLVFSDRGGRRERIRLRDAADALTESTPGSLGPNVLLRPVVERSIIPTVAYLGGGAEVAYFAQTTAVAEALDVQAPLVIPRWSGLVVEPRVQKILDRYSLKPEDFRDPHAVESQIARSSLPAELRQSIRDMQTSIADATTRLAGAKGSDIVPPAVLEGLQRNLNHRIEKLERRFAASIKRQGNDALRDAAIARGSLFPFGIPQERALNIVPLLSRHGDELIAAVMREARRHAELFT
jgi:bacillithiol biosynthesis cysteine-adding enzyme BshC